MSWSLAASANEAALDSRVEKVKAFVCEQSLIAKKQVFDYVKFVVDNKGLPLLAVKPGEQKAEIRKKARGLMRLVRAVEGLSIPFDIFDELVLNIPSRTLARGYQLSGWVKLPIYVALGAYLFAPAENATENFFVGKRMRAQEISHQVDYDFLLKYDVRFSPLNQVKVEGEKLRQATVGWRMAETEYIDELSDADLTNYHDFEDHPLFADLRHFIDQGVTPEEGMRVLPGHLGKIPDAKLNQLFLMEHHLQIELEAIYQSYLKDSLASLSTQPPLAAYIGDPFWREILAAKLSPAETLHWLETDLTWRVRLDQWALLGEERLNRDDVKGWTQDKLTIEEIHQEIRNRAKIAL